MIITFPCAGVWLVFGAGLQKFLRDPAHLKLFNIAMALLLVGSILPVVWDMLA
jgi:threonine/homoserine/homoserine lactone efflux protein